MLELMYITNNPLVAKVADSAGVDRVWIDLEKLGKAERQKGDTVKSDHSIQDIREIKPFLKNAKLQVRINPIHSESEQEIEQVISCGADIIMLPYYKTVTEVQKFLELVNKRARTCLLLETKEAHECLDNTLEIKGIDEIHIGLNDLHLSYHKQFMFELLTDGTVADIAEKIKKKGLPFGFGGIAKLGAGMLPAELILAEHYHLGSTMAILSRSFCNADDYGNNPKRFEKDFIKNVSDIREYEDLLKNKEETFFIENYKELQEKVCCITSKY